jgi:membrane protease YdiL (CAAX protease family)
MAMIVIFVARQPSMVAYYELRAPKGVLPIIYYTGVDLFGWEFIWRGFMLFAFARAFGPGAAIWLQAIPFAFMHLGKPEMETLTTLFGGVGFGFIAWQSQSFFYPFSFIGSLPPSPCWWPQAASGKRRKSADESPENSARQAAEPG